MRRLNTSPPGSGGGGGPALPGNLAHLRRRLPAQLGPQGLVDVLEAERDRWFLWVPVFFGTGIGIYFALPFEPVLPLVLGTVVAALGLALVLTRGTVAPALAGALLAFSLGLTAAKLRTDWIAAPVLADRGSNGQWLTIHGWLEEREQRRSLDGKPGGERLTVRVAWIDAMDPATTPALVRMTARNPTQGIAIGDGITVKADLRAPPDAALPGGYDFSRLAYFQQLGGIGFATGDVRLSDAVGARPWTAVPGIALARWREDVGRRIRAALPGETGAIAAGLVTGERGGIPASTLDALRDSGLSHILAISGFNMAVMAGAVFLLTRRGLALFPNAALTLPLKQIAATAGLLGATLCLLLSGAGSATTRAFVMIMLGLLAVLLGRSPVSMRNLALAGLFLLAVAPETLLDVSFQMSFSAVVALMAVWERVPLEERGERPPPSPPTPFRLPFGIGKIWPALKEVTASTAVATLAVAPFATYHFHKIAVYGLLANLIAVPLFAFVMMPLIVVTLAAMPFGAEYWPLLALGAAVEFMMRVAHWTAALPGASIRVTAIPLAALVAAIAGGLWLCLWRRRWRWLGLLPIGAALLLSGTGTRPDVLIARAGRPVAVRQPDGTLAALPSPGAAFTLSAWLEADGDPRTPEDATTGTAFFCDDRGCTARIGKDIIAFPDGPEALTEDCRRAAVVVMRFERQRPCASAEVVVDRTALTRHGAHALTATRTGWRTVSASGPGGCGDRPWCLRQEPRAERPEKPAAVR